MLLSSSGSRAGLVWGKELYVDATQVNANADLDSLTPRFAVEARETIQAHLAALFSQEDTSQEQQKEEQRTADLPTEDTPLEKGACSEPTPLPTVLPEPLREELAAENAARHDWIAEDGRQHREEVHGSYRRTADFRISTTDPDATPMHLKGGGTHLGYQTHYVVDGGKARIILGVLVAPSEVMENQPMLDLVFRARFRHKLWPRQVTGDTAYGTGENIVAVERQGIRAYFPLPDFDHRTAFYGKHKFRYDPDRDVYICPNNAVLPLYTYAYTEREKRYQGDAATCNACPLKPECTSSNRGRVLNRSFDEEDIERVRAYHTTERYHKAMRKREVWVEPLFAEGKQWHGMRRFRLRRLWRVNCEALIRATGQNLKRLLTKRGWGRRPWPQGAVNTLSEPPSEEHLQLSVPARAEKAFACEQHLPVKDVLNIFFIYQSYLISLHYNVNRNFFFSYQCFAGISVFWMFLTSYGSLLLFLSRLEHG